MKSMLSPLIGLASGRRPLLGTSREDNSYNTQPSSVEARPQGQGKSSEWLGDLPIVGELKECRQLSEDHWQGISHNQYAASSPPV